MTPKETTQDLETRIVKLEEDNRQKQKTIEKLEESQKELEKSQTLFHDIFQHSPLPRSIIRLSDLTIQKVNTKFEEVLGYTQKELIGKTPEELNIISRTERKKLLDKSDGKSLYNEEVTLKRKNKETFPIVLFTQKVEINGDKCFVSTMRDISMQRKLEEDLRQAQKMESIGQLAGGIAHDFNNMLNVILGYTNMAIGQLPENSQIKEDLEEVENAGIRASELVKQILTFSRASDKEYNMIEPEIVAKEAIKLLKGTLPPTLTITDYIEENMGSIFGNETQIYEIIMNLSTNAMHAMENQETKESHGKLEIRLETEIMKNEISKNNQKISEGEYIKLTIKDSGQGINKNTKTQIFDPYFTTKPKNKGTGLGLSVVQGIVKSHKGKILVNSQPGKGAEFTVYLPKTIPTKTIEKLISYNQNNITPSTPTGNILLVDDNEPLVKLNKKILEKKGYTVHPFTDSQQAQKAYTDNPSKYNIIVTDQLMPNLTGVGLSKKVREISPNIPILLLSGFSDSIDKSTLEKLNIIYKTKPIKNKTLLSIISQELGKI